MRKVVFSFGLIIPILLFSAGACSSKAKDTEWTIPADFVTYTDENKTFSISYPSDWEVDISIITELDIISQEWVESIDPQVSLEEVSTVFYAGLPCGIACYHPSCNISIEPLGYFKSITELNAYQMMYLKSFVEDYEEFSRETTVIGGRESIINEFEATFDFGGTPLRMHTLVLSTYKGDTSWSLSCNLILEIADYTEYEDDFHNIIRSLQLH